jgi:nucleoside-diphosphate-sugar epimerase
MRLFCFGFGYSASALAERLSADGRTAIAGTRTRDHGNSISAFAGDARSLDVVRQLEGTTHALVSIPPGQEGCPVLRHFEADLAALKSLTWVGYLSTVGVYGDAAGGWVDENTPIRPASERALRRAEAEAAWMRFGDATHKRVEIFRLPGIYGPGRSVFEMLKAGTAKRMIKPGQVFNRIHVADIAGALARAMVTETSHRVFNITDDEPSPPQDVVAFGASLLGLSPPPETAFDATRLSPMAASFYAENKRVRNVRMTRDLGYHPLYPSYREGLRAILQT